MAIEIKREKQQDSFMADDDSKFGRVYFLSVVTHPTLGRFSLSEFISSYENENTEGITQEDYEAAKAYWQQEVDEACRG